MYNYNTTRSNLILREYGRNIQKLMESLKEINDKGIRTQKAHTIVKLMEVVNPNAETFQKRWDDLFILSDYQLDIDGPNPNPTKRTSSNPCYMNRPPMELIKYKYYGRHMESLLKRIITLPSLKGQEQMLIVVGKLMRRFSSIWNNDYISNEKIMENIKQMLPSDATLDLKIIRTISDDGMHNQKTKPKYYQPSMANASKKEIIAR